MSSVLGVPLVAVVGDFAGWRFPFLVIGVALFMATILLFFMVPHQHSLRADLDLGKRLRRIAAFPLTWHMAGSNLMARITWGVMATFFPAFLQMTYGLGTAGVALPVSVVALWTTSAPLLEGKKGGRTRRLPITAALLLAAAVLGLGIFHLGWGVWFSVFTAGFFMLLIVPITTILMILVAETGGASRGTMSGIISGSNWVGTALGAAIGGLLVAQAGYGALSFLLPGTVLRSGLLLMALMVNERAVARARQHFSTSGGSESKTATAGP